MKNEYRSNCHDAGFWTVCELSTWALGLHTPTEGIAQRSPLSRGQIMPVLLPFSSITVYVGVVSMIGALSPAKSHFLSTAIKSFARLGQEETPHLYPMPIPTANGATYCTNWKKSIKSLFGDYNTNGGNDR